MMFIHLTKAPTKRSNDDVYVNVVYTYVLLLFIYVGRIQLVFYQFYPRIVFALMQHLLKHLNVSLIHVAWRVLENLKTWKL